MATQLQIRRGTSAQVAAFTGAEGEIVVNTTNDSVVVNDGSTAGGFEMARVDGSNWAITNAISTTANITVAGNILLQTEGNELQFNTSSTPVNKIYTDDTYTSNGLTISADNGVALKSTNNYLLLDDTGTNEMVLNVDSGERMRVTSTGIDVTGSVVASQIKAEGTEPTVFFNDTTTGHDDWKMYADWDQFQIQQYVNDSTWTSRLHFAANGNATFSGTVTADGLTVDGITSVSATNPKIQLFETDTTNLNTQLQNQAGDFLVSRLDDDAGSLTVHFSIDHSTGNVSIPSGDLDVTGSVTADGATDGTAVALFRADNNGVTKKNTLRFEDTDTTTQNDQQIGRIEFYSNDTDHAGVDAVIEAVSATTGLKELRFLTSDTANTPLSRLAINKSGDISFYNSAGTSQSLHWDSSAESLGIGTTSPTGLLTSYKSQNGDPKLGHFYNDNTGTAAEAAVYITNSSSVSDGLFLQTYGQNGTTAGGFVQDASIIGSGTGASGGLSIMTRANADMRFYTNGHTNERMRISSSGQVGLGLAPSAWSTGKALEIGFLGNALWGNAADEVIVSQNAYYNSGWKYATSRKATHYSQYDGNHRWFTAPTGTADAAISWTQAMTLDSSGHITSLPTYNNGSASAANMVVNSSGLFLRSVSSGKYKTDIEDVQDAYADSLLNIRPVYYRSTLENDNTEHSHWGFIAEEVAEIDPRLVHYKTVDISYSDDGERIETELETPEPEGVQYDRFAPLMLKLIQKQQATITALEARITQLENN